MKKLMLSTIGLAVLMLALVSGQREGYSNSNLPYPTIGEASEPNRCIQRVSNEMFLMSLAFGQSLNDIKDQEKPPSDKVDEVFESMRTYNCWLTYLCEAALFSADVKNDTPQGGIPGDTRRFIEQFLDTQPGCADPDTVEIPGTKLQYLSECFIPETENARPSLAQANYQECQRLIELEFSDVPSDDNELSAEQAQEAKSSSNAYIRAITALKSDSAESFNRALKKKLGGIITKMHAMENGMETVSQHIQRFDALLPCYVSKCD